MSDKEKKSPELEEAELRKTQADAVKAEIEAEKLWIELKQERRKAKRKKQDDRFEDANESAYGHGIYRFSVPVTGSSVFACKEWITTMRRYKPGCDLRIEFNSGGGSVLDGLELFDAIREASDAGHRVTTYIGGLAASMAGILVQAGDERLIGRNSWLHLHEVSTGAIGKASDLMDEAELAKRLTLQACEIYADRSPKKKVTAEKVHKLMERHEVWLSPEEALEYGFVDSIA